jgi:hypothetical protein
VILFTCADFDEEVATARTQSFYTMSAINTLQF